MDCWTYTDARHVPSKKKDGGFHARDIIGYGGYAKVVCQDNTEIEELYYDGYGILGGKDIYALVTEWNRADLLNIFARK